MPDDPTYTGATPPQDTRNTRWYTRITYADDTTTTLPAKPTPYDAIRHARTFLGDYTAREPVTTITLHPHPTTPDDTAYIIYDSTLNHDDPNPAITDLDIILSTHTRTDLTTHDDRTAIATDTKRPRQTHTPTRREE